MGLGCQQGIRQDSAIFEFQVDSVPLPRKITSLLPRLACVHIQVQSIDSFEKKDIALKFCVSTGLNERKKDLHFVQNFSLNLNIKHSCPE